VSFTPEAVRGSTEPNVDNLVDVYRSANRDVLADLYLGEQDGWNDKVKDVFVVLCASRSGSSLIFDALTSTGEVAAPGGEHEPWLTLSENKFPFLSSDEIDGEINQKDLLLRLVRNDLLVRDRRLEAKDVIDPVRNRLVLRRQSDNEGFARLVTGILNRGNILNTEWGMVTQDIGKLAVKPMPVEAGQIGDSAYGMPLENPPFIDQPLAHIATEDELNKLPLLFKSPSDAYRPGFYESLFPNARVNYIHLSRGFVQTTNGRMDGWQMGETDFISNPVGITKPLQIEDYSITDMSRIYWCFDLFNGWEDYTDSSLVEVAVNQWLRAHKSIVENFEPMERLTFEDFYSDPPAFYARLTQLTGIDTSSYDWNKSIMSTETPSQQRWLKRASLFRNLKTHLPGFLIDEVVELQGHLGYSMEEETWR
jgi:hypothetical protein